MQKALRSKQQGTSGKPEGSGILKLEEPETRPMSWERKQEQRLSRHFPSTRMLRVKRPYEPETIIISRVQN